MIVAEPSRRSKDLFAAAENDIKDRFLSAVEIQKENPEGDVVGKAIMAGVAAAYINSGIDTAQWISSALGSVVEFDLAGQAAAQALNLDRQRVLALYNAGQQEAIQYSVAESILRGESPQAQAKRLKDVIGLTARQARAVDNYRELLEKSSLQALRRELRDRRFDSQVLEAKRAGSALSEADINRMVASYRNRLLLDRAAVLAESEAHSAINSAFYQAFSQAVNNGDIAYEQLKRRWNTAQDEKRRYSHRTMQGQIKRLDEPFTSGNGYSLMYPGDINAPTSETIRCRCWVTHILEVV